MDPGAVMAIFAGTALAAYTVKSISAVFVARAQSGRALGPGRAETEARLARIEQAVDSIALEVERISEGQRFTTKLLAERGAARGGEPPRDPGHLPPGG